MFVTIWMCTHEWSLISIRATAFTFETCHQPFNCLSALTRSTSWRSFRFPRTGTLIRIRSIASVGVSLASCSASAATGCSIRSAVSWSRLFSSIAIRGSLRPSNQSLMRNARRAPRQADRRGRPEAQPRHGHLPPDPGDPALSLPLLLDDRHLLRGARELGDHAVRGDAAGGAAQVHVRLHPVRLAPELVP